MPYDLFISYSWRDNEHRQITALKTQIESFFRALAGRELRIFFDAHEIHGMDDWRLKIQRGLRESQVFYAELSRHCPANPYCRWEMGGLRALRGYAPAPRRRRRACVLRHRIRGCRFETGSGRRAVDR